MCIKSIYECGHFKIFPCNLCDCAKKKKPFKMLVAATYCNQCVVQNIPPPFFDDTLNIGSHWYCVYDAPL